MFYGSYFPYMLNHLFRPKTRKDKIREAKEEQWQFEIGCMLENMPEIKEDIPIMYKMVSDLVKFSDDCSVRCFRKCIKKHLKEL